MVPNLARTPQLPTGARVEAHLREAHQASEPHACCRQVQRLLRGVREEGSLLGLLPEIDHAYVTVGGNIYLWNYLHADKYHPVAFNGLDKPVRGNDRCDMRARDGEIGETIEAKQDRGKENRKAVTADTGGATP